MTSTTVGELVERLLDPVGDSFTLDPTFDLRHEAADKLSSLQKEIDALRGALEPFALLAGGDVNMNDPLRKWFTVAQLHDARAALATGGDNG